MSNAGKNSMRWLETTSTMQASTQAEAASNIPSRRFASSQEESKIVPLKTTTLAVAKPTTMFETTVEATTAGKNSGSDSVKRITASPGMIKTQIAKISYTYPDDKSPPHSTQKYIKPMTTMIQRIHLENPITPTTPRSAQPLETIKSSVENYAQKKSEREQEILEIQEMLEEITKNPPIFNEVPNEPPITSLQETTNNAPKFKKTINEFTKKTYEDITSSARITEKPTPPNSGSVARGEAANIPAEVEQPAKTTERAPTSASTKHMFQRSKTDLNFLPNKAATTRWRKSKREPPNEPRSKSTQPPVTKSSELLPGGSPDKKKSYNPEDARRFMEEQRKKRQKTHEFLSSHRSQQQNEKEQIKRRLEELHKYSRKVVSKNLKNAQKRTGAAAITGTGAGVVAGEGAIDEASPRKTAKLDAIVLKRVPDKKNQQNKKATKITKNVEHKAAAQAENLGLEIVRKVEVRKEAQSKDAGKPGALMENQKRVGLLRKPEIKDHSFGAIKEFSFDKENVALDLLTPKLTAPLEQPRIKEKTVTPPTTVGETQQPTEAVAQPQPNQSVSMNNLLLEMPEARLQHTRVVREQATQVHESSSLKLTADSAKSSSIAQTPAPNERTELPYWLKPSAVQVYPYNFIMAVRRKLEAIANPPPQLPIITDSNIPANSSSCEELKDLKKPADTPLSSMPTKERNATTQQNVKRRLMAVDIAEESHSADFATHSIEKTVKRSTKQDTPTPQLLSQTYSDVTSNFSSISLVLPVSNTCSEVSSIKSDSNASHTKPSRAAKATQSAEEDNTTVSSSIFNSPEKQKRVSKRIVGEEFKIPRPVSPLSLESIEHMKISSKVKETNIAKHVPQEVAEVVEVNLNRLLQDFNRSLSQVIEVNEQLKSTLDKSQQLISPERKHASNNSTNRRIATEDDYSTDFEGGSSANAEFEQIATKVIRKNPPLPQHRKNLFELANIVKPLQTSSKSDTESGATSTLHRKINIQNLDINLESVGNSSAEHTTHSKNKFSSSSGSPNSRSLTSADSLDRRLQSLEQLKNNLRESILISKANRGEIKNNTERLMHISTASNKEEKQPLLVKPDAVSDDKQNLKLGVAKKQNPSHSLSNSTVDSRRVSSRRSFIVHSSSEYNEIQTAFSDCASAQSADAATMLSASSSPPVADKSYTFDSKSNSPKAKTFTITQNAVTTPHSSPAQKSLNTEEDETIAEELQNVVTTPKKHNNKDVPQGSQKTYDSSADSSPNTASKGATKAAYVKAHINRSRGDFMPAVDDENAVSNESHFQAAAAAATANDTRTESDSAAPPPSYKALSATTKTSEPPYSEKSASMQQKYTSKSSKHALGHELITVFNQSDMELSIISSRNGSISETSLNYSSVGLYEKLIQTETTKSEQLTVLLKMREKALLDRTKGQIAWLELQKERYKAKGLLMQITAIKKKQRGILLKMEKEREEIKRLLQSTNSTTSTHSSTRHNFRHSAGLHQQQQQTTSPKRKRAEPRSAPPLLLPLPILPKTTRSSSSAQQQQQQKISTAHSAPIIRANYELESSRTLEDLLQKREADLRKRREHVERLILWHQRLDQEEAEVQQLELMLLNYNNVHAQPHNDNHSPQQWQQQQQTASSDKQQSQEQLTAAAKPSPHKKQGRDVKMERRLKEIDKSLRELSSISVSNNSATSTEESATSDADYVRTSGSKLNKLWRRLTTQQVERFEATRRYKLCKADLERLYEEAKLTVLRDFAQDEQRVAVELLDKTTATVLSHSSLQESLSHGAADNTNNKIVIPRLNLNFSSGQSDPEDAMLQLRQEEDSTESIVEAAATQSTIPPTAQGDTYCPCAAEEQFIRQESGECSSLSTSSSCSTQNEHDPQASAESIERHREELLERNVQKFMELTQRFNGAQSGDGLQRSLSDTQIAENCLGVSKKSSNKAAISQRNIAYYGVKTQKRPSKVVNVEIANSLSSASSILTASSTLRSVQSLKTQTFSELNNSSNNYAQQNTSDSKPLSANVNNIPLPVSTITTTTPSVANSMINSLDSCYIREESKESASAPIPTSQATISATPFSTSLSQVSSAATLTQSDTQAHQISEKLEEISAAVTKLTQSNSLLVGRSSTIFKPPSQQQLQIEQSTKSSSTEIKTDGAGHSASISYSYSSTFEVNEPEVTQLHSAPESVTIISSNSALQTTTVQSTSLQTLPPNDSSELLSETMLLAKYNADFEDTLDETRLEDISLPQFETTNDSTQSEDGVEEEYEQENDENARKDAQLNEADATYPIASSSKATNNLSQVNASLPPPPMPPSPPPPPPSTSPLPSTSKEAAVTPVAATAAAAATNNSNSSTQPQLMPDIINELELRRCQQQIQQYEHVTAVPYNMYVREIPNKPPPPYVPPAHGSPMTTIFPSEERIKDLTYRRTHELYCEILKTEYTNDKGEKLPSVLAEKITNIYERIILDICREFLDENNEVLTKSDPSTFHGNLAFFNPPDRLSCLQTFVYKEVRRCLAMDKKQPKRSQVYSVYGQRAKRDHIGKIIIQEMYDEDDKWCNFHHEEAEVLDLIIEEMLTNLVGNIAKEVLLEEGGNIDEVEVQTEQNEVTNDEIIYEDVSLIESTTSALDAVVIETETIGENSLNAETNAPTATI